LRRSEVDEELRGELHDHPERKTRELIICRLGGPRAWIPRLRCGTTSESTGGWSDGARAEGQGYVRGTLGASF